MRRHGKGLADWVREARRLEPFVRLLVIGGLLLLGGLWILELPWSGGPGRLLGGVLALLGVVGLASGIWSQVDR
ncbi:MAG: hypothetical protein R3324_19235 [Halobacteriales archaeon]|nr:hypothetical protein [Halobacteriales archaeon]